MKLQNYHVEVLGYNVTVPHVFKLEQVQNLLILE